MKKSFLFITFFITSLFTVGQSIKGITIGEKSIYSIDNILRTTIEGKEYSFATGKLNAIVYKIVFTPTKGTNTRRVYLSEAEKIKNVVESTFNIKLKWYADKYVDNSGIWYYKDKKTSYIININYDQYLNPPIDMDVLITNLKGAKTKKAE